MSTTPIKQWKLKIEGLAENLSDLEDFFDRHHGNADAFYWTDPMGVLQTVRFSEGKNQFTYMRGIGDVVGLSADITLELVI